MLESFSDWKSIGFILYLIGISFLGYMISATCPTIDYIFKKAEKEDEKNFGLKSLLFFIGFFSLCTFIVSIIHYVNIEYKAIWDYIYMFEVSYFKIIDFQILSLFDLLDNTDLLNTAIIITSERTIWMIIESLIDSFEVDKKKLILVQIIISSPFACIIGLIFAIAIFGCIICLPLFKIFSTGEKNNSEKKEEQDVNIMEEVNINNLEQLNIEYSKTNSERNNSIS